MGQIITRRITSGKMNKATMVLRKAQRWRTATLRIRMIPLTMMVISMIRRSLAKLRMQKSISRSSKAKSPQKTELKTATLMEAAFLIKLVDAF